MRTVFWTKLLRLYGHFWVSFCPSGFPIRVRLQHVIGPIFGFVDFAMFQDEFPTLSSRWLEVEIWKETLKLTNDIDKVVSKVSTVSAPTLDEIYVLNLLVNTIPLDMHPIASGFYLYSLRDLLSLVHNDATSRFGLLHAKLEQNIHGYPYPEIFIEIPLDITDALTPITGKMGLVGGKAVLNRLIGHYAAREPTHIEVIDRLLRGVT